MVQILLMLEVLFTQDSKVEDLFCSASSGSELSLFFSNYFFSLRFKPIQDDFQHGFARMTDEADSSVVLTELQVALFRECNKKKNKVRNKTKNKNQKRKQPTNQPLIKCNGIGDLSFYYSCQLH